MLRRALRWYDGSYAKWPMRLAFATCTAKALASDVVSQKQLESAVSLDAPRSAKFALYNGLYCGCFQHLLYNRAYPALLGAAGPGAGAAVVARTLAFEMCVHFPLGALPAYYASNALLTGGTAAAGLRRYADEFESVMATVCKIWLPAHLVTFALVPVNFRIAWVASVSFCWLVVLSHMAPMASAADDDAGGGGSVNEQ